MCPTRLCIRAICFSMIVLCCVTQAQARRKVFIPGQRAIVIDERLSALRAQPDVKAGLEQRLRRGRAVGILGATANRKFLRVAVSRNVRGWVLAEAVARAGNPADAERLLKLIEETEDDFTKVRLARLCADEFRATPAAPKALLLMGEIAEKAAERLTRDAKRRVGDEEPGRGLGRRDYVLNHTGLDRYNRIGVTFDYDEAADRLVYDGASYRELLRLFPKSGESKLAREKLGASGTPPSNQGRRK
jgi:hypothetical protein